MSDSGSTSGNAVDNKGEIEMDDSSSIVAEDPCPVCLSSRKSESGIDGCAHTFCYSCITEWLKVSESCPLCKAPVTEVRTKVNGKQVIKKMSELKAKAEADRIIAQANEVPMTSEREAVTQLIHQQRAEVQQLIASKAMNKKNKRLNDKYREATSKLTQYTALRDEMDRLPRRDIMGDMRFREVVYMLQLVWKEISRPTTAIRFNPSMACSDPDGLMRRLRPFLMRELKIVMLDKRRLSDQVYSKVMTAIQNYRINHPDFEMVLLNSGMFNPGFIAIFAHLLYDFCASGLELEAFDANSTYSINAERAPSGRFIPSLLPLSSRTSGPIVIDDEDEDEDDEPEILDQLRAMSDSSSSDGVHEIYNHRACHVRPSTNGNSICTNRDTRTLEERMNAALFPNNFFSNPRGILPNISSMFPSRFAPRAPEVISIDDESNSRGDEARINSIHRRERDSSVADPSWLNVTGQDRPSTSTGFVPFGSRPNHVFSVPDIGRAMNSDHTGRGTSSSSRNRASWNTNREIGTSWRAENGRKADARREKRGREEKERRRDFMYMGVRNGSRKNTTQHYFDKLHYEEMSATDLEKLSGELSSFTDRIKSLKNMCDKRISEKRRSDGAQSSNNNEAAQNTGPAVVDVDDDLVDMQEDAPGPSNSLQDDSVVIL